MHSTKRFKLVGMKLVFAAVAGRKRCGEQTVELNRHAHAGHDRVVCILYVCTYDTRM